VLVIDDDPIVLKIMKRFLEPHYTTTLLDNAVDALSMVLGDSVEHCEPAYDIILCDVVMPNMNGYTFCSKLRAKYPPHELPVIFLTVRNHVEDIVEGFNSGGNDFLVKPVLRMELYSRIRLHITLAKINKAYSRFVPTTFLNLLGKSDIMEVKLGDQIETNLTVMVADVRSFTTMSEQMSPQENFEFINQLLSYLGPTVRENGGFIDKFVGDGIMALFPTSPRDALAAAKDILDRLAVINAKRYIENQKPIMLGIGLHNGTVMLGCVGEHGRMDATVIGDVVNVAFRIEELTKCFGSNILISHDVLDKLEQEKTHDTKLHACRYHGKALLKGRERKVKIYEVFQGDNPEILEMKLATRQDFERAVALFEKGTRIHHAEMVRRAKKMFEDIVTANHNDKGAKWYTQTCSQALELYDLFTSSAVAVSPEFTTKYQIWRRSMKCLLLPVEFPLLGLSPPPSPPDASSSGRSEPLEQQPLSPPLSAPPSPSLWPLPDFNSN
jgi:two-component system sensor histidine kinase ChiS